MINSKLLKEEIIAALGRPVKYTIADDLLTAISEIDNTALSAGDLAAVDATIAAHDPDQLSTSQQADSDQRAKQDAAGDSLRAVDLDSLAARSTEGAVLVDLIKRLGLD